MIRLIKKRNGSMVDFSDSKIRTAISKACIAAQGVVDEKRVDRVMEGTVHALEEAFKDVPPSVEFVQDTVEKELMKEGLFEVAKAYIVYRHEHAKEREEKKREIVEQIGKRKLKVTKHSGGTEVFSAAKLRKSLEKVLAGYEKEIDVEGIVSQCEIELFDGISTKEVFKTLIMVTRSFIERDPAYSQVASRLVRVLIAKEVIGGRKLDFNSLDGAYRKAFIVNLKRGVEIGRLDARLLDFDLELIAKKLMPERDEELAYLGIQTLYDRYLLRNPKTKEILETVQAFWMRVAMGMAVLEKNKEEKAAEFYEALSTLSYVPSTPTLFHAGTPRPQLSSCYLNTVPDALDMIFKTFGDNAQLSKWSGGIGTDWTSVRGTGARIGSIGVESQGVIPFLKIANDTTAAINRSGKRRGAACVYLETWHYDIEDYIELRKNTGDERRRTHDMDTANWIPDLFMERVRANGEWTLLSPDEAPELHDLYGAAFKEKYLHYEKLAAEGKLHLTKKVKALDLWKKMLAMLYETGHPWVTFKDACNIRSPQDHIGVVHSSNLCTEITLNTSADETAVCNLGSINIPRHMKGGVLDIAKLARTAAVAMRMLDNVIDINFYPTKEAKNSNMKHRPVGLGIMGLQDALYVLDLQFDSEQAVAFSDEVMELISYHAIAASSDLAAERGAYASYKGSKWDRGLMPLDTLKLLEEDRGGVFDIDHQARMDWTALRAKVKKQGMRNSNCLAIAPTATISNIAGSVPSIEPIYKNLYVKSNQSGDFTIVNPYLASDLKQLGLWNEEMLSKLKYHDGNLALIQEIPYRLKEKYKDAFMVHWKWLIRSAAHRAKWIDQSQSLNLFFLGTSGKEISDMYFYAWDMGLKTTYYLRTLAASQVEKSTVDQSRFGVTHLRPAVPAAVAEAPVAEAAVAVVRMMPEAVAAAPAIKLCKIEDPTCEACQ